MEMSVGSLTETDYKEPIQVRRQDSFKTLYLTFATNGDLTDVRVSKN